MLHSSDGMDEVMGSRSMAESMTQRVSITAALAALTVLAAAPAALAQPGSPINCADPLFQAQVNMCAQMDHKAAETEMNAVFDQVIAQFREQDRAYAEEGPQYTGAEAMLRESQEAWATSSGALCAARSLTFFGGSMRPAVHSSCLAMVKRSRTEELRWLLD